MFRPPVNRAMRVLDRAFFQKRVPLTAARVWDRSKISICRKDLEKSKDLLVLERMPTVHPDPEEGSGSNGRKCLLLKPEIKRSGMSQTGALWRLLTWLTLLDASTWSTKLQELVTNEHLSLLDYDLELKYDYWTYRTYVRHLCSITDWG